MTLAHAHTNGRDAAHTIPPGGLAAVDLAAEAQSARPPHFLGIDHAKTAKGKVIELGERTEREVLSLMRLVEHQRTEERRLRDQISELERSNMNKMSEIASCHITIDTLAKRVASHHPLKG